MKKIYKIVKEGKTYTFTSKHNASVLLKIPLKFTEFSLRQMNKWKIDEITVYDFKTQEEIYFSKVITKCNFCGRRFVKREEQKYCAYCGSVIWKELTYNAMQKAFGKKQAK